jgi:hypothetical protein
MAKKRYGIRIWATECDRHGCLWHADVTYGGVKQATFNIDHSDFDFIGNRRVLDREVRDNLISDVKGGKDRDAFLRKRRSGYYDPPWFLPENRDTPRARAAMRAYNKRMNRKR